MTARYCEIAGPFGSLHLADLGADVIKIEDASQDGDVGRSVPPYAADGDSLFFPRASSCRGRCQ